MYFFFNDTATTEIYTLSLHDALPICSRLLQLRESAQGPAAGRLSPCAAGPRLRGPLAVRAPRQTPRRSPRTWKRSEEHTSELQSRQYLVCRLLLEKKNKHIITP